MAYTRNWDTADPADTDEAKYGAQEIREFKIDDEERFESVFDDIDTDPLAIASLPFKDQGADPAAIAAHQRVYSKSGELFARNSTAIYRLIMLASGTKMLFYQDAAPVGWTIQNTLDDKIVYITKGSVAGGQTGGGVHSTGSWTISGLSGASHTLTVNEIPSHQHFIAGNDDGGGSTLDNAHACAVSWVATAFADYVLCNSALAATLGLTSSTGGGAGHTHTVSSAGTWRPSAYCCIIASKD